jgi:hypothetical protein
VNCHNSGVSIAVTSFSIPVQAITYNFVSVSRLAVKRFRK